MKRLALGLAFACGCADAGVAPLTLVALGSAADIGGRADASQPDLGAPDAGPSEACRVLSLDPVTTLHSGASWGHDLVRTPDGYAAVVLRRGEGGFVRAFLYRLPDDAPAPPPEPLTAFLEERVNLGSVRMVADGDSLWVVYGLNRWIAGSGTVREVWVTQVLGSPPYRRVRLREDLEAPGRIEPVPGGGLDLFYPARYVPERRASRVVRLGPNLQPEVEGRLRTDLDESRGGQWLPPQRYFEVRGVRGAYRIWHGHLDVESGGELVGALGPDTALHALHLGLAVPFEDTVLLPSWELEVDDAGQTSWRSYVRRVTDEGLVTEWAFDAEAKRPNLAQVGTCGWVLATGTGELRESNPISTNGDLRWLRRGEQGRLEMARQWEDVLPAGAPTGCHTGRILAAGPESALVVWKDGCGPRSVFFRKLRFIAT